MGDMHVLSESVMGGYEAQQRYETAGHVFQRVCDGRTFLIVDEMKDAIHKYDAKLCHLFNTVHGGIHW